MQIYTQNLKKCPFCGGEGYIDDHFFKTLSEDSCRTYGVVCRDCGVQTRQFYDTPDEAAEAWNRRDDDGETS